METPLKLFKKLAIKPIWYWERHRPYFSRQNLSRLPTVQVKTEPESLRLNILCTPATLTEAVYSAWSWSRYLGCRFGVRILVDGQVNPASLTNFSAIVSGLEIQSVHTLIDPQLLALKNLGELGRCHPLGRKLLLLLSLQKNCDLLYCDNDVLAFQYPRELIRAIDSKQAVYNMESENSCYDALLISCAQAIGQQPCEAFNSGLFYCPANSLDLQLAELLAESKTSDTYSWFDEQTILAILMNHANALPLDQYCYVISAKRQFWLDQDVDYDRICTRHFTGPVRHLMYSRGYGYLLREAEKR